MSWIFSVHWVLVAALWYFINGLLHDIFVIKNHTDGYNRELLRLLMDGHVLMLSGAIMAVSYFMMLNKIYYGPVIALVTSGFMLIYCTMIFPFLKSFGTITISLILIAVSVKALQDLGAN